MFEGLFFRIRSLLSTQLRRNIVAGSGASAANALISLVSYPLYLHYLGYARYGVWLALSTVLTFSQLGNLGINPAVTKLVAESYGVKDMAGVSRCLTTAWLAIGLTGGITCVAAILFKESLIGLFRLTGPGAGEMSQLLPAIAVFSLYIFIVEIPMAALVGLNRADLENYYRTSSQVLALVLTAALLALGFGIESLLIGNVAAYVFLHWCSLRTVRRTTGQVLVRTSGLDRSGFSRMLRFGGWVFAGTLVNTGLHPLNRVIISRYAGVATLPIYEIAFAAGVRVRSLIENGLRAMMPEVSRLGREMTDETLLRAARLEKTGLRLIGMWGVPLFAFLALAATPLLRLWLGSQFNPMLPATFRIMILASFASLLYVPAYYILMGLGEARICFESSVVQSSASVGLIGLLAVLWGAVSVTSVSLSVAFGMTCCCTFLLWQLRRCVREGMLRNATRHASRAGAAEGSSVRATTGSLHE